MEFSVPGKPSAFRWLTPGLSLFMLMGLSVHAQPVSMFEVEIIQSHRFILTEPEGFDLDHDQRREFAIGRRDDSALVEIYESDGDNSFVLTHSLDFTSGTAFVFYAPGGGGNADGDVKSDLVVCGRTGNIRHVRVYEALSEDDYPTELVWERNFGGSCRLADLDRDGSAEVLTSGGRYDDNGFLIGYVFTVHENVGDDSFSEIFAQSFPTFRQAFTVLDDLDQDSWPEALVASVGLVQAYEANGDNSFQETWSLNLDYADGQPVNATTLGGGEDLDGDGRREFVIGGLKTVGQLGDPSLSVVFLFEAHADNDVRLVTTFVETIDSESVTSTNVIDLDGDGFGEIVIGRGEDIRIYKSTGDDAWEEIWATDPFFNTAYFDNRAIGAGDHDGDGKGEIIFLETTTNSVVYEIDPADAVDLDADGFVDAIDNCPAVANAGQEDVDLDGVGDLCDNCVTGYNPAQGDAVVGSVVTATDEQTFGWGYVADVRWARGDLADVSSYGVAWVLPQLAVSSFSDPDLPAVGAAFFYLVRPDCALGSWQTSVGAEPGRDAALP